MPAIFFAPGRGGFGLRLANSPMFSMRSTVLLIYFAALLTCLVVLLVCFVARLICFAFCALIEAGKNRQRFKTSLFCDKTYKQRRKTNKQNGIALAQDGKTN